MLSVGVWRPHGQRTGVMIGPRRVGALDPASQEEGRDGGHSGLWVPRPHPLHPRLVSLPQLVASASHPRRGIRVTETRLRERFS